MQLANSIQVKSQYQDSSIAGESRGQEEAACMYARLLLRDHYIQ